MERRRCAAQELTEELWRRMPYRFVGKVIAPITNEAEIRDVERAAPMADSPLGVVSKHIETALKLLSQKPKPDCRNSMKESISAVEAVCKIIAQNDKTAWGRRSTC